MDILTTCLINQEILSLMTKDELTKQLNKQQLKALEVIYEFEESCNMVYTQSLESYQNTSRENYEYILRDFISDINKSSSIIIDSLITLLKEDNSKNLICSKPILFNHEIRYIEDSNTIQSVTMQNRYIEYINKLYDKTKLVSSYINSATPDDSILKGKDKILEAIEVVFPKEKMKDLVLIDENNLFSVNDRQSKREHIIYEAGKEIDYILQNHINLSGEVQQAFMYFSSKRTKEAFKDDSYSIYYSFNLADENVIPKKSQVFTLEDDNGIFDVVAEDACQAKKKGSSWHYRWNSTFCMSYYIKKELLENYTKKQFFDFFCMYKDFLSRFTYYIDEDRDKNFNQKHPFVLESKLMLDIKVKLDVYESRYLQYYNILQKIVDKDKSIEINYLVNEWKDILKLPEKTANQMWTNKSESDRISVSSVLQSINELVKSNILKLIGGDSHNDQDKLRLLNVRNEENFINDVVCSIFDNLHLQLGNSNAEVDKSKFFNFENRATFHTTLKDSYVLDFRNDRECLNELVIKESEKNQDFKNLVDILRNHNLHDYYEFDKDFLKTDSLLKINELKDLLDFANRIRVPLMQKSGFKLRKLGNYNAFGIYFSHSKTLGVDFRKGKESYIHESAHHIDLNTKNKYRKNLIKLLNKYFKHRITFKADYYFRSEELIARAAEVSILLLAGRYKKHRNAYESNLINKEDFIQNIKNEFENSNYAKCMGNWEYYKGKQSYINIEDCIQSDNVELLNTLVTYFYSFWSGRTYSGDAVVSLSSLTGIDSSNKNKFKKDSHYSYRYHFKEIYTEIELDIQNQKSFENSFMSQIIRENFNNC